MPVRELSPFLVLKDDEREGMEADDAAMATLWLQMGRDRSEADGWSGSQAMAQRADAKGYASDNGSVKNGWPKEVCVCVSATTTTTDEVHEKRGLHIALSSSPICL